MQTPILECHSPVTPPAAYHSMLSGWHHCGPTPAAILGNKSWLSKNADPYPRMPLTCYPPSAAYHSMLSGWHHCSPAPAAILGNKSHSSQHVEKLSWATCSFHILQSITSYCWNKVISAYVCSVVQFSSILEVSSFVKYEQDLLISYAYLFARLLSFQSSIVSKFCLCLLSLQSSIAS